MLPCPIPYSFILFRVGVCICPPLQPRLSGVCYGILSVFQAVPFSSYYLSLLLGWLFNRKFQKQAQSGRLERILTVSQYSVIFKLYDTCFLLFSFTYLLL